VTDRTASAIGAPIAGHFGPVPAGVTLAETTFATAWNVQGDPARAPFADEARRLFGLALPDVPNAAERHGALTALWLGPTSWLLVASDQSALNAFAVQRDAINAAGGALFDVTASSVGWTVGGPRVATVLAKHCPLDFHAASFPEGTCAQSVLGHVNALFYRHDLSSFTLLVARSYARAVWRTLCQSAAQYGYDVLPPRAF
jgi:heterotetrameric sarcosine oxidase gamma subunit